VDELVRVDYTYRSVSKRGLSSITNFVVSRGWKYSFR